MIERKKFFDAIRSSPFPGSLTPGQVDGINCILDEWDRRKLTDLRWLSYMLATTFHETAHTMQPIAEYGKGKGRRYGEPAANGHTYYGRGFVQLTWQANYQKMSDLLEVDLVNYPDRAMEPKIATKILFVGMLLGTFTNKKLAHYFGPGVSDWVGARRIINGIDRAQEIATIARKFYAALLASKSASAPNADVEPPKPRMSWLDRLLNAIGASRRKG